jgi:hypothetical protein
MKSVLISQGSDRSVAVSCQGDTVHAAQVVICSALATAGRGYRVTVKLPCWTATFNGTLIEGPGLGPSKRPKQGKPPIAPTPTGPTPRPTNLPDSFSGCVK